MRILALVACLLSPVGLLQAQQTQAQPKPHAHTNPAAHCGNESKGLPSFYYEAVLETIKPPNWNKSLNRITVGAERKIVLLTDGKKFLLWTDTPLLPNDNKNIVDFLRDLDESCRLPPDPADAADLIKIDWQSKELTEGQYSQLHRDFTDALSKYVSQMQERYPEMMATRTWTQYLDTPRYTIDYNNWFQHVEVKAWDVPDVGLVKWVYQLHKLAEDSFHRSFGPTAAR